MRIKKFKYFESIDDNFYTEITEAEYDNHFQLDENFVNISSCHFTDEDINYIENFLKKEYPMYVITIDMSDCLSIKHTNGYSNLLSLSKLKHDWFLIVLFYPDCKYYKCDRLDGFEKCFKEKCISGNEKGTKKFKKFIESISGTELMNIGGSFGPGYGQEKLPVTLTSTDTRVVFSDIDNQFYTQDEYDQVYGDYLKKGGEPLDGFSKENLERVLDYLKNAM